MVYEKLVEELKRLNPDVIITSGENEYKDRIYASVDGSKLRLPDGFSYDVNEGINNKQQSINGEYVSIKVLLIEKKNAEENTKEEKKEEEANSHFNKLNMNDDENAKNIVRVDSKDSSGLTKSNSLGSQEEFNNTIQWSRVCYCYIFCL